MVWTASGADTARRAIVPVPIVFDDCRRCGAADHRYTVAGRGSDVDEAPKAFARLKTGRARGKVVVRVRQP